MIDLTQVNWKNDKVTFRFISAYKTKLVDPSTMSPQLIAEAITYCQTFENPYSKELVRRAGSLKRYNASKETAKRIEIVQAAARAFGMVLI